MYQSTAYVWFDTEYSSLEIEKAVLLQVAMRITDADLRPLDPLRRDINAFVKLPDGADVSPWIKENMPDIVEKCRSNEALEIDELDKILAQTIERVVVVPGGEYKRRPILAGNSIHADWWLAQKYLPRLLGKLHYRHLDVTALKIQWQDLRQQQDEFDKDRTDLVAQYCPEPKIDPTARRHDAYYDVQASIAELAYYRQHLLAPPPPI